MTPWGYLRASARSRAVRRMLFAVTALAVADRFEPAVLGALEEARYEDPSKDFRFGNSDLFGLGPLVQYLREHPRGRQHRVLFVGNSITYGYLLETPDTLPAQYQHIDTSAKVFNAGINNLSTDSARVVTKAVIDSVDLVYVLHGGFEKEGRRLEPMLPRLMPVEDEDLTLFHLAAPAGIERRLTLAAGRWRLYRDAYRLQAAIFGSSTRQYFYGHKGPFVRALIGRPAAAPVSGVEVDGTVTIDIPVSTGAPDEARQSQLRAAHQALWQLGDLAVHRRKPIVVLQMAGYSEDLPGTTIGDFNRQFAPYGRIFVVHVPAQLRFDLMHLTKTGAARLARALWDLQRKDVRP